MIRSAVIACLVALALFGADVAAADGARSLEFAWMTEDRVTGHQSVAYSEDGTITIQFEYADRGRGPSFQSVVRVRDNGLPARFSATGRNNTRATIEEHFRLSNGSAVWRSTVEQGRRRGAEDAFYFPFNDTPEIRAILARALLKTPGRTLPLLPSGTATLRDVTSIEVASNGESRRISLFSIDGLALAPVYVWLDASGDLFGFTDRTFAVVRRGWEASRPALNDAERSASDRFYEQLAATATKELAGLTVVDGARIFDSIAGRLTEPATVFVWNGSISAIYFGGTDIPKDTTVIDGHGKTLMPSMWDMHNHVTAEFLPEYLAFGITNVRDMGNNYDALQHLIRQVVDGRVAGPDIHPLGFIDRRGSYTAPVGLAADTLEEALSFVEFYARHGYHGIKLYSSIKPDWVAPLAAAAKSRGMSVSGHIPAFMSAEQAIRSGYGEVNHANQLLLAFLGAESLDTRGPARFLVPGTQGAELDIDGDRVGRFLSLMKEKRVALDPTLAVIMEMFRNRPGEMSPIFADLGWQLPEIVRRRLVMAEGYNQGRLSVFQRSSDSVLRLIGRLHREGIQILPGTDNYLPGFTLLRELVYYTEAGIPNSEILQLATIAPARYMGLDHRLGSITVGKDAHMFLVDGNPVEDIRALYRVEQVFKGRHLYYAPDLLRAEGVLPIRK
ncbi:MAG: amidohydrolase family protein [Pseudomonadota bacterium]